MFRLDIWRRDEHWYGATYFSSDLFAALHSILEDEELADLLQRPGTRMELKGDEGSIVWTNPSKRDQ